MTPEAVILGAFRRLRGSRWKITSPKEPGHNCIAYAVGDETRWWGIESHLYWPDGVDRHPGICYLIAAYQKHGYAICDDDDGRRFDPGYDKIVVYDRGGYWKHAAKLVAEGVWRSKLGPSEDIEHETPEGLSGAFYGEPFKYMKKRRANDARPQFTRTETGEAVPEPAPKPAPAYGGSGGGTAAQLATEEEGRDGLAAR